MPQIDYTNTLAAGIVGDIASSRPWRALGRTYPKLKHLVTLTEDGGTDDGDYTVTITGPSGSRSAGGEACTFAASGQTADQIVTGLTLAINNRPNLKGFVRATADLDANTIAIEAARSGEIFSVALTSNPGTNLSQATTVSADQDDLPLGVGVADLNGQNMQLAGAGRTFLGVVKRGKGIESSDDGSTPDAHRPGQSLEVVVEGEVFVAPEEAVEVDDPVFWRVEAGAGETLGAFRASPSGGQQVATVTPTAAELDFMILIEWSPADGSAKQSVPLLSANPDGSASATEICDAWRTAFATAQADGLLVGFAVGGTATLTITGPAGEEFRVSDVGEGVSAVADTTPADVDAVLVPPHKARWARAGSSATAPAVLSLNP